MAYVDSDGIQTENNDSLSSTRKPIIHTHLTIYVRIEICLLNFSLKYHRRCCTECLR